MITNFWDHIIKMGICLSRSYDEECHCHNKATYQFQCTTDKCLSWDTEKGWDDKLKPFRKYLIGSCNGNIHYFVACDKCITEDVKNVFVHIPEGWKKEHPKVGPNYVDKSEYFKEK